MAYSGGRGPPHWWAQSYGAVKIGYCGARSCMSLHLPPPQSWPAVCAAQYPSACAAAEAVGTRCAEPGAHCALTCSGFRDLSAKERAQAAARGAGAPAAEASGKTENIKPQILRVYFYWRDASCERRPLRSVLARLLAAEASGETAALVRSTMALTQLDTPGAAGNVVPAVARARFNARLLPGTGRHPGLGLV